jgi:hypothetical protein
VRYTKFNVQSINKSINVKLFTTKTKRYVCMPFQLIANEVHVKSFAMVVVLLINHNYALQFVIHNSITNLCNFVGISVNIRLVRSQH